MNALVDARVWSKVLRTDSTDPAQSDRLRDLILDNRVAVIGPVLQEILSGVRNKKEIAELRARLAAFDLLPLT